ncbi:MAG: hypothetical protein ACYC2H_12120 [Thermoplasmatota archaeon]
MAAARKTAKRVPQRRPSPKAAPVPRKAAKPAARKAPAARAAPAPRAAPRRVTGKREDTGYVATILQPQRDYLVIYEEPDSDGMAHDDSLLLDIDAGQPVSLGEVDLEQKLDLELSNNTNAMGTVGFVLACLGALVAVSACIMFAVSYPDPWYTSSGRLSDTNMIPGTLIVGVLGALTMLAGVILTHYGRRIQARGNLSRMRIVEKSFQPRVGLGDEF